MKFSTPTDISKFDPEQQDALLAEMQAEALRDFQAASIIADRAKATTAFAHAAKARNNLLEIIGARAYAKRAAARFA